MTGLLKIVEKAKKNKKRDDRRIYVFLKKKIPTHMPDHVTLGRKVHAGCDFEGPADRVDALFTPFRN